MPRYFFNVRELDGLTLDQEGSDCGALDEALDEAAASARDIAKQFVDDRKSMTSICVDVVDEGGKLVATLPLMEMLEHPDDLRFRGIEAGDNRRMLGTALAQAESEHARRKLAISQERVALDHRDDAEDQRWSDERAAIATRLQ